ncbi:MAG: hypothetical protein XD77_1444 [Marinimicrobia bacterium 46_47]|nr:MAG: hypothetical protein XD77_1444 [Marinimicrobia bacterium 46_47]
MLDDVILHIKKRETKQGSPKSKHNKRNKNAENTDYH